MAKARKKSAAWFVIQEMTEREDGGIAWVDLETREIKSTADGLGWLKETARAGVFRVVSIRAEVTAEVEAKPLVTLTARAATKAAKPKTDAGKKE